MGIPLFFVLSVFVHAVIINGVEQNHAPNTFEHGSVSDTGSSQAVCDAARYDCAKVNEIQLDFSLPIQFTDVEVDSENRVTLQWESQAAKPLFLLRVEQDPPTCWLVEHRNDTTYSNGKYTYDFPCLSEVTAGSVYNVSVLSHNISSSYSVYVPSQGNDSQPTVPVIAVGESSCPSSAIHGVFQLPRGLTYTSANVDCWDNQDPTAYNMSQQLGVNVTEWECDVRNAGEYTVKLEFEGCGTSCPDTLELPISIAGACEATSAPTSTPSVPPPRTPLPGTTPSPATTTTTTEPDGSVVQKPSPNLGDSAKRTTIIAVVSAVLAALLISTTVGCIYKKKRQRDDDAFVMRRLGSGDSDTSSLNTEKAMGVVAKSVPSVLLLYSYDCAVHERVVIEFAAYLKHECGCDVALDIWEQDAIKSSGAAKWLDEKLDFSDFIIVVGSAGARFKCQRKKQFRMKQSRPVPDMFVYGADQITEKVRFAKQFGSRAPQCVVVCFEYATTSDIPPKLDTLTTLSLMKDIRLLHSQLHGSDDSGEKSLQEPFVSTPTGKQLAEALKDAGQFFEDNPDWLGQCLEPLSPVAVTPAPTDPAPSVNAPPQLQSMPRTQPSTSSPRNRTLSQASDKDGMLEKRQHKRRQEEEVVLQKVASSNRLSDRYGNPEPSLLNTLVPAPNSLTTRGRTNSNTPPPPPLHPPPLPSVKLGISNPAEEFDEEDFDDEEDEMLQLQKDIDFINNYHYNDNNATDVLLQLDTLSSSYDSTAAPVYSFSNPLYSQQSSTKHMLQKNGLGRVSISMNGANKRMKPNHNNNSFVVNFNEPETNKRPKLAGSPGSSTYL